LGMSRAAAKRGSASPSCPRLAASRSIVAVAPRPIGAAQSASARSLLAYFPQVEEAIWSEFPRAISRHEGLFRDGQQSEYLALQMCELDVERLHGFAVLDEFVARSETEQSQELLGGWVGTITLLGIER
jgi:hypothetical protein